MIYFAVARSRIYIVVLFFANLSSLTLDGQKGGIGGRFESIIDEAIKNFSFLFCFALLLFARGISTAKVT